MEDVECAEWENLRASPWSPVIKYPCWGGRGGTLCSSKLPPRASLRLLSFHHPVSATLTRPCFPSADQPLFPRTHPCHTHTHTEAYALQPLETQEAAANTHDKNKLQCNRRKKIVPQPKSLPTSSRVSGSAVCSRFLWTQWQTLILNDSLYRMFLRAHILTHTYTHSRWNPSPQHRNIPSSQDPLRASINS